MFERGQAELKLVDPVPEDFQLGLIGEAPFSAAAQPRRGLRALGHQRQRHQPLRAVWPVDKPGGDLPGPVPGTQGGAGRAGVGGGPVKGHPIGAFKLRGELKFELPCVEPVLPLHGATSGPCRADPAVLPTNGNLFSTLTLLIA